MKYTSNLKQSKEINFAKNMIYNLALSVFFTLLVAIITINVFNLRVDEVLSDSMAQTFTKRDIVVIKQQDKYEVGDIIEYKKAGILVTHRIIEYDEETNTFTTKGDNSQGKENVSPTQINGKVIAVWKNGRVVYHTIKNSYFIIITLVIGAWVLSTTIVGEKEMKKHNTLDI